MTIFNVIININAALKQQYTSYNERNCHRCTKCLWLRRCCCDDVTRYSPRDHASEELFTVKQKMTADQFAWFHLQSLGTNLQRNAHHPNITLNEVIENFLSSNIVKAEILTTYNDSILSTLQANISSLKLTKVASENLLTIVPTLATDYSFEDLSNNSQFLQQMQSGRFSYENLYSSSKDENKNQIGIKYIWIIGQSLDNSTYSINCLFINMTSQFLIDTLLSNGTGNIVQEKKQHKIVRISTFNDHGELFNEDLSRLIRPGRMKTTRMLSYFNPKTITSDANFHQKVALPLV